jgi:hypothetical protein
VAVRGSQEGSRLPGRRRELNRQREWERERRALLAVNEVSARRPERRREEYARSRRCSEHLRRAAVERKAPKFVPFRAFRADDERVPVGRPQEAELLAVPACTRPWDEQPSVRAIRVLDVDPGGVLPGDHPPARRPAPDRPEARRRKHAEHAAVAIDEIESVRTLAAEIERREDDEQPVRGAIRRRGAGHRRRRCRPARTAAEGQVTAESDAGEKGDSGCDPELPPPLSPACFLDQRLELVWLRLCLWRGRDDTHPGLPVLGTAVTRRSR